MRETLLLISLTVWAFPVASQTPPQGPTAWVFFSGAARGPLSVEWAGEPHDSAVGEIPATHWKEGALVGGVLGAVGGALVGRVVCGMSDEVNKNCTGSTVLGGVVGAAVLAIAGALIGGQFPKGDGSSAPPE